MQRRMIEKILNYWIYERGTNVENKFSRISFYNTIQKDKRWGFPSSFIPVYKLKTKQEDQSNELSNFQEHNLKTWKNEIFEDDKNLSTLTDLEYIWSGIMKSIIAMTNWII